jgi:hypothetical protein
MTDGPNLNGVLLFEYARPAKYVGIPESASDVTIAAGKLIGVVGEPVFHTTMTTTAPIATRARIHNAVRRTSELCHCEVDFQLADGFEVTTSTRCRTSSTQGYLLPCC